MNAGELNVQGIGGSMAVHLLAAEMDLRLVEPQRYRPVEASVAVGELEAKPWQLDKAASGGRLLDPRFPEEHAALGKTSQIHCRPGRGERHRSSSLLTRREESA